MENRAMASSANGDAAADTSVGELGLPGWMENLLKPGVGPGVFTTLKASLVGLVFTLVLMLMYIEDATARMHVSIFLAMSVLLLGLVIWFVGELQKEEEARKAEEKDK